ncbi:YadA-like family protein [Burkholderia sp. Leaf177]|uniref:YadA-like family protein n=1 Tax=Burkholderia sp. Leaf177 TaxID=1736287 RepID=UPI001F2F05D0|nr:YadA-like family protein [Burkholderia sp. Leaf177]
MMSPVDAFAQNIAYLGSETDGIDTCSRAGSDMQACGAWSPAFTAVSGSRLAYLTSQNGISEGGVWAGNLSSGLFYGSGPGGTNGVVADSSGTTVSGSNLTLRSTNGVNVSSSKIINVAAGTQSTDTVNVGQLTPLVSALGGTSSFNADGSVIGPKYSIKGTTYTNVGDALSALANTTSSSTYLHVNSSGPDSIASGANATAIGAESVSSGGNTTAIGHKAISSGPNESIAIGSDVQSTANDAISIGSQIVNAGASSIVIGNNAVSLDSASNASVLLAPDEGTVVKSARSLSFNPYGGTGTSNSNDSVNLSGTVTNAAAGVAIGSKSSVTAANAVALGASSTAAFENSMALGAGSATDRANTVSVGSAANQRQITNVAAGAQAYDAVNVTQLQNVATLLGGGAKVNADGTIQPPSYTVAGAQSATVGDAITKIDSELGNKVAYDTTDKSHITLGGVGTSKLVTISNVATGAVSATSTDAINGSQLYSTNQRVGSLETFAGNIGDGGGIKYFHANSKLADSLATGTDSVAIGGAAIASANNAVALGSNSVADRANSVSVGAAGKERQVTNVAAGTASTDAVNVGQLTSISDNLGTLGSFAVKYDTDENGKPNYERITLGGASAAAPTLLTNVKAGSLAEDSTDAVNGSQLYATNKNLQTLQDFTNSISNGGGIKYFHSNSMLADSSATGADSVAIGGAAVSSGKNSVALGSNSVADRDNSVSVGAAGSERQITNVAAGTASTDAANVGQLNAVSNSISTLSAAAIKYDTNADGTPDYSNATLGNGNTTGTALHNVAAGTSSMDAVNLGQINDMIGAVTNLANGAYNPMFSADGNRDTEAATSSGAHSVASGANAVASGVNAVASGASSVASGANAVAVGANSSATAKNAVALGSGSVADRANSVSVGTTAAGGQRQITNVAAGTEGTDAVNVNQMQQSVSTGVKSSKGYTDALRADMDSSLSIQNNHINSVGAMSSAMAMMAGSAAAISDKDNRFAAGTGVYRDKAAIAVGFQKRFGTNMVLTIGGSTTGEESTGGAGFAFGF